MSLLILIIWISPDSDTRTTAASQAQILFRVAPLLTLACLVTFETARTGRGALVLLRRPGIYWFGFCFCAGFGGFALDRYPLDYTLWKSVELLVPVLVLAPAVRQCTLAEVERCVYRVAQGMLVLVGIGAVVWPENLLRLGPTYQLHSSWPPVTPNKLAILAGLYLILTVGRGDIRSWRTAMALTMVGVALSRSVIGVLFIGGWFFLDPMVSSRKNGSRIIIVLLTGTMGILGARIANTLLTKGGAVDEENIITLSGRTLKWQSTFEAILEWPLGWGINGAYREIFVEAARGGRGGLLGNVHGSVLESFAAAGLIGGACWCVFWLAAIRRSSFAQVHDADRTAARVKRALVFALIMAVVDSGLVLFTGNLILVTALALAPKSHPGDSLESSRAELMVKTVSPRPR